MDTSEPLLLMNADEPIGTWEGGRFRPLRTELLPLYLRGTGNFEEWLRLRAIDEHRSNSRLLKKALRLRAKDDISTVLHFNAVTLTDAYWVKRPQSALTYADVRFTSNYFDQLALRGDPDSFNQPPSRTPELTNVGSYEKCWRLLDGVWWMYKAGSPEERFSEVFSSGLARLLGIPAVEYEPEDVYVRCRDFTEGARVNFESAFGLIGDRIEYEEIWDVLRGVDERLAASFTSMAFFDAILFNMDRHEHNWGVLRDVETGEILRMAPLYDHNISLVARGYPRDPERRRDRLIADFLRLARSRPTGFSLPELPERAVREAARNTGVELTRPRELPAEPEEFVARFVCGGYARILEGLG